MLKRTLSKIEKKLWLFSSVSSVIENWYDHDQLTFPRVLWGQDLLGYNINENYSKVRERSSRKGQYMNLNFFNAKFKHTYKIFLYILLNIFVENIAFRKITVAEWMLSKPFLYWRLWLVNQFMEIRPVWVKQFKASQFCIDFRP